MGSHLIRSTITYHGNYNKMAEGRVNAMRGYKATLHNPNTSQQAKQHAQSVLDNELGGDQPSEDIHNAQSGHKDPMRVAAGYKAAQHNPNVTEEGREGLRRDWSMCPRNRCLITCSMAVVG